MALMSFFKSFVSNNQLFYDLFDKVTAETKEMADLLKQLTYESNPDQQAKFVAQLRDKEKTNDLHVSNIFTELGKNFITPFDREDIHLLATALDDVADNIFTAAKKMHLYSLDPTQAEIQKMAELISSSVHQVAIAVSELKNMKNMRQMTDAIAIIKEIESQSDDVFDFSIQSLFNDPSVDAKDLLKRREVFSKLESVTDKCEDAANVVESIIVKYA
jgi:hypothetical protein